MKAKTKLEVSRGNKTGTLVSDKIYPITNALRGSFVASSGFNYKIELLKALSEKYL